VKRGGSLIAGIVLAAFVVAAPPASARTFQVTRTADSAPNGCSTQGCTLREAVIAANSRAGADVVELRPGKTYRIDIGGIGEDAAQTGDFDLTGPTSVVTPRGTRALVFPDGADRAFEAFGKASFRNIEIRDGLATQGGAIASHGGTLELIRLRASGNAATATVSNDGPGRIEVARSDISGNSDRAIQDAGGGGVRVFRSRFAANNSSAVLVDEGGGIVFARSQVVGTTTGSGALYESGPGSVTVSRSRFEDLAGEAALDFEEGGIEISGSTIRNAAVDAVNDFGDGSIVARNSKITDTGEEALLEFGDGNVRLSGMTISRTGADAVNEFDVGGLVAAGSEIRDTGDEALLEFGSGVLRLTRLVIANTGSDAVNEFDGGSLIATRSRVTNATEEGLLEFGVGSLSAVRARVSGAGAEGVQEFDDGDAVLTRTRVSGSDARGVAESGAGGVRASRSVVRGNEGGISVSSPGASRITDSSIVGNVFTGGNGGGVALDLGSSMTISGSTVADNSASNRGGGIYSAGALTLVNSTIAGNRAVASFGGGIYATGATSSSRLNAATVARNRSGNDGGGIYLAVDAPMRIENSLIALNAGPDGFTGFDCFSELSPFDSRGHNLISDDENCAGFDGPGDLLRSNPKIGQLRRNGGPTETIALKAGSPAVDAGGRSAPPRDQRGRRRDRSPDIGAFER
jgi:CSLREA domain-containing protein